MFSYQTDGSKKKIRSKIKNIARLIFTVEIEEVQCFIFLDIVETITKQSKKKKSIFILFWCAKIFLPLLVLFSNLFFAKWHGIIRNLVPFPREPRMCTLYLQLWLPN